jgi:hypothetical protein
MPAISPNGRGEHDQEDQKGATPARISTASVAMRSSTSPCAGERAGARRPKVPGGSAFLEPALHALRAPLFGNEAEAVAAGAHVAVDRAEQPTVFNAFLPA